MHFDFTTPIDRRNSNSEKWNVAPGELPMWVADMDFPVAPQIVEAIKKRLEHPVFGYNTVPEQLFQAYQAWWQRRHGYRMETQWMLFCAGVVPAISSIVRKVTSVGENVLIQAPVYNHFYASIANNGRTPLSSDLRYDGNTYSIDFQDLEQKLADPQTSLMILCNPHNPVGKVWDRDTLDQIGQLAQKHHVTVLSDEIHCDITDPGVSYVPFASVSETNRQNSITCIAPTKCFNIAGLHSSCIVVPDPVLRHKVRRAVSTDEIGEPSSFSVPATVAAFNEAEPWLEAFRQTISHNKQTVAAFLAERLPKLHLVASQATYLLWIDCGQLCDDAAPFTAFLRKQTGLFITAGNCYGAPGKTFVRVNIACPASTLLDGLNRLEDGVHQWLDRS